MDKGYIKDIEAEGTTENKSISDKLAFFTGAAAVLGLVAAFNQNIVKNSEPVVDNTVDRHVAQGFGNLEQRKKEMEMREVYEHIKKNFEEIETMIDYLPHQEAIQQFDPRNSLIKRTIPSITVGGKVFKLEVESLDCFNGVNFMGACEWVYTASQYKKLFRVILSNGEVQAIYQILGLQADLFIYDKVHPETDNKVLNDFLSRFAMRPIPNRFNNPVAPNFTAFVKTVRPYAGEEYRFLDSKLGEVHAALKAPYDAKKARQAAWNGNAKNKI